MKVLGIAKDGTYIAEVSHTEIEKFMNLYYGKQAKLKIGEEIDLGTGYNWYDKTKRALKSTEEFFKNNSENINTITKAFTLTTKENK